MQSNIIINKLPEVIKCIIYDYVDAMLNYLVELQSDKFIGNPIDLFNSIVFDIQDINFYHINKLSGLKTSLHFIGLNCFTYKQIYCPQEILNKLQKFSLIQHRYKSNYIPDLPNIKILNIYGNFREIPNFVGLLELDCSSCYKLTEIPHIVGLKKLDCSYCEELNEIPNIKGLQELNCYGCDNLTKIPHIIGLKKLNCSDCDNLIKIPRIVGLLKLNCSGCVLV